jgi:hypothetical protein
MKLKSSSRRKHNHTKSIPRLPDLEHAKAAVPNSRNVRKPQSQCAILTRQRPQNPQYS